MKDEPDAARRTIMAEDSEEKPPSRGVFDGTGGPEKYLAWEKKMKMLCLTVWRKLDDLEKAGKVLGHLDGAAINHLPEITADTTPEHFYVTLRGWYGSEAEKGKVMEQLLRCKQGSQAFQTYLDKLDALMSRASFTEQEKMTYLKVTLANRVLEAGILGREYSSYGQMVSAAREIDNQVSHRNPPSQPQQQGGGRRSRGRGGHRGGRGRGRGGGHGQARGAKEEKNGECWTCGKTGHYQYECTQGSGGKARRARDNSTPPASDAGRSRSTQQAGRVKDVTDYMNYGDWEQ